MVRKLFPLIAILLLVTVVGASQNVAREQLGQQLLTQEEIQELLGSSWILDNIGQIENLQGALATAVGTYIDTNTSNSLVAALIVFETVDGAGSFLDAIQTDPAVDQVQNLLEESADNPDLLPEQIVANSDNVVLLLLRNGLQQLMIRKASLVMFFRTATDSGLGLEGLILVADFQLGQTLEFCENSEEPPAYCATE